MPVSETQARHQVPSNPMDIFDEISTLWIRKINVNPIIKKTPPELLHTWGRGLNNENPPRFLFLP